MSKELLAKGRLQDGRKITLKEHLFDTEAATRAIFRGRILDNWCRFFRVKDRDRFLILLRIAALFHDIGKANKEFLDLLDGHKETQTLRHEWISVLILHCPHVRQWLDSSELDLDIDIITAAVLCHHLDASSDKWGKPRKDIKKGDYIELYLDADNEQVQDIFLKITQVAQTTKTLSLDFPKQWIAGDPFWETIYWNIKDAADNFELEIEDDKERRSLLLAVKAGLISADSVASGIFRTRSSEEITLWVDKVLHQPLPIDSDRDIKNKILIPCYEKIQKKNNRSIDGKKFESKGLKDFQKKAHLLGDRVLLLSACGSGKTIFAYKWFQAMVDRYKVGHIIFLYPTRGTATEGFKDYVAFAPETDASLLTGTAIYELKEIAKNPSESTKDKDYTTEQRLYALGYWDKRFFSATVDQFLSFLTHSYSSLCLLPVLADSAVVIDEIHSFSHDMFANLISFLKHFKIPVLCMTATLPKTRREQLKEIDLRVFPTVEESEYLKDLAEGEQHIRYDIQLTDKNTAEKEAIKAYQDRQEQYRILWVVNTVDRCREISKNLENQLRKDDSEIEVLTYHSRFTLQHRSDRHQETVAAFTYLNETKPRKRAIAVTTQVCEMSLDLDADIIITELAPISSLIQRMGRGNRHLSRGKNFRAKIFVYEPEGIKPYQNKEIAAAKEFINAVLGEVSQAKLAEELENYSLSERLADGSSSFIDGGYYAMSEPFRGDEKDWTVNSVLKKDLAEIKKLIETKQPYDGYILPVPKYNPKFFIKSDRPIWLPKYLEVADEQFYCHKKGFGEWKKS